MANKKVNVYIDSFNLYYCALKHTNYKWLDVKQLCSLYFKKFTINEIKYFTAYVKVRQGDKNLPVRQQVYLRALKTIPKLKIILGSFKENVRWMPLITEIPKKRKIRKVKIWIKIFGFLKLKLPLFTFKDRFQYAPVLKSEEKGSDVNLAVHLLRDAYNAKFDAAIVVSNDSDLREAISFVVHDKKLPVYALNPDEKGNNQLDGVVTYTAKIRKNALAVAQFPDSLQDKNGTIQKPQSW